MGCFGWGAKSYVEKVSVLFRSPMRGPSLAKFGSQCEEACEDYKSQK